MIKSPVKAYSLIPRREFNPEISAFSNLLLDLVDFRDRVRPMANDIARHDASILYQKRNPDELEQQMKEFREGLGECTQGDAAEAAAPVEEGYSSMEIAAESGAEETAAEAEAAEPDLEAAAKEADAEENVEENEA